MARVVEVKLGDEDIHVAVYRARCKTGACFIIAYVVRGSPRLLIVPAQPSPLCITARLSKEEAAVIEEALSRAYRISSRYRLPVCSIPRRLLRERLSETLDHLKLLGIVDELHM